MAQSHIPHHSPGSSVLHRRGVWSEVRPWLANLPTGAEIIWLTYNFGAPDLVLSHIAEHGHRLAVLCAFPGSDESQPSVHPAAWRRYRRYVDHEEFEPLRGVKEPEPAADAEDAIGLLHAKAIVAKRGDSYLAVVGSFNFTGQALEENAETFTELTPADAEALWNEARALMASPQVEEVEEEHCSDRPQRRDEPIEYPGAPSEVGEDAPARHPPVDPTSYRPVERACLLEALDQMLRSWPPGHPRGDTQWNILGELLEREDAWEETWPFVDVLYLPVGVGKTFIALRWLLGHVEEDRARAGHCGVYLVPNEWIQRSVERQLGLVVDRAVEIASERDAALTKNDIERAAGGMIRVVRPSDLRRMPLAHEQICATVADECHNWNPLVDENQVAVRWSYTSVVNDLDAHVDGPVLGLSATPCRFNVGRFSVPEFVSRFRGVHEEDEVRPFMTLRTAIESGFLSRPEFVDILQPAEREEVRGILSAGGATYEWGDYSRITLSKVWEALDANRAELLERLMGAIKAHKSKRVLVFIPPVHERADEFVEELGMRIEDHSGEGSFVDFRATAGYTQAEAANAMVRFRDYRSRPGFPAVLVTIDRMAEGVSVDDIDLMLMLRATLSPRVVVQSLGRGLRRKPGRREQVCHILDAVEFEQHLRLWDELRPQSTSVPAERLPPPVPRIRNAPKRPDVLPRLAEVLERPGGKSLAVSTLQQELGLSKEAFRKGIRNNHRVHEHFGIFITKKWVVPETSLLQKAYQLLRQNKRLSRIEMLSRLEFDRRHGHTFHSWKRLASLMRADPRFTEHGNGYWSVR